MTGEKLKEVILGQGITLASAARRLGMTPQHLNQALSAADVKSGLIERVSTSLGLSIASLYGEVTGVSNITGNGSGVNSVNNDTDVINRFLSIIEEKDRQIAQLMLMMK